MNDNLLSQTVLTVNGFGLAVIIIIPFVIAKRPAPAELDEGCFDVANQSVGNIAWWLIFISCLIVGLAFIAEAAGMDAIPGFGPR